MHEDTEWEAERIRGMIDPPRLGLTSSLLLALLLVCLAVALWIPYYEGWVRP